MFAVADVKRGTIVTVIDIAAPPERVFEALTDPAQLASWWGSAETYRTHDWACELRPGGAWGCVATNAGSGALTTVGGTYLVIDPPRVLEYSWRPSWEPGLDTVVRYELEPTAAGTRVRVAHRGFEGRSEACKGHEAGWNLVLGWLRAHL